MKQLPYKCKMCFRHGVANYSPDCDSLTLDIWKRCLVCDGCADHRERVMKKARHIDWIAKKLICLSAMDEDKVRGATQEIREALTRKTRELAEFVCRRHRKAYVWDAGFVDNIMRRPEKTIDYCWMFDRMVFNNNQLPVESFDAEPIKTPHIQS
jgi:hypothetical protein